MLDRLRLVWSEPRAAHPPQPGRRDGVLLGAVVAIGLIELAVRADLSWMEAAPIIGIMPTILWRRARPLSMVAIAFGALACMAWARIGGSDLAEPHATAFVLLLVGSLFRWGSGRELLIGSPIVLLASLLGLFSNHVNASEFVGGLAVVLAAMALGAAARYRARLRSRELDRAKLEERERLARDLHDTVAHHVSAIAIRAQAGLATAPTHPAAATDALRIIAAEASRTLAEMREIVRGLRGEEAGDLAPLPRIGDIRQLSDTSAGGPVVAVAIDGDVDDLPPSLSAAIFRLAQESVTNARRHARHATRIEVGVTAAPEAVHLRVCDDGQVAARPATGYGLTGMIERAELHGGTCSAGPGPERGWLVDAVLPRRRTR